MIRVGTVFSGIGAIEHALLRMGIKNEIAFACDNGDVDIFSKKIPVDISAIDAEFLKLKSVVENYKPVTSDDIEYSNDLRAQLENDQRRYKNVVDSLECVSSKFKNDSTIKLFQSILTQKDIKKTRAKEYKKFYDELMKENNALDLCLKKLQYGIECINDFKKDNDLKWIEKSLHEELPPLGSLKSSDGINWDEVLHLLSDTYNNVEACNGKRLIRNVRDIAERLEMLHEKIEVYRIRKKVSETKDFSIKKEMIDDLYKPYVLQNKVRQSYLANYDLKPEKFHWNVSFLDGHEFTNTIDLFVGGSPCQSFSMVGKQRGLEDTRGTLFYEYARLVSEIKPKVFIYENVRAVLSNDGGKTWETMKKVFDDLGYSWQAQILNARDYGIPQNRERLFVVGFRNDLNLMQPFSFPKPVKLDCTMKDFLLDNVSGKYYLPRKGVEFVTKEKNLSKKYTQIDGEIQLCQKRNQQFNWHGDFVFVEENSDRERTMQDLEKYFLSEKVRKYVLSSGTKNFYSKPQTDLDIARTLLTTMHKMHRAGVDNYVTTEGRLRKLTPRECLRLMGFCDSFKIVVSDTAMYQQAGNSIVVDVLIAIMTEVLKSYPRLVEQ